MAIAAFTRAEGYLDSAFTKDSWPAKSSNMRAGSIKFDTRF